MIKEINYSGHTAQPSDYLSEDGELAVSMNLIPNEGAMCPTFSPEKVLRLCPSTVPEGQPYSFNGRVVFRHHPKYEYDNYLIVENDSSSFILTYWMSKQNKFEERKKLYTFLSDETFIECKATGNVVTVLTSKNVYYCVFQGLALSEWGYSFLGVIPELPSYEIGLETAFSEEDSITNFTYPAIDSNFPGLVPVDPEKMKSRRDNMNKLLGSANKLVNKYKDEFLFPFFIRYAYRLYDGSLVKHSAPILMIPASCKNPIYKKDNNDPIGSHVSNLVTYLFHSKIRYRLLSRPEALSRWKGIITGIEFYVSAPLYTYDQDPDISVYFPETDTLSSLGWLYELENMKDANGFCIGADYIFRDEGKHWIFKKRYISDILVEKFNIKGPSQYVDFVSVPKSEKKRISDIEATSNFYKYRTLDISYVLDQHITTPDELVNDDFFFQDNKYILSSEYPDFDTRNIVNYKRMTADPFSHIGISARTSYEYNGRLHLANLEKNLFDGFSLTESTSHMSIAKNVKCDIYIYIKKDGYDHVVCRKDLNFFVGMFSNIDNVLFTSLTYFFYPDPDAYKMCINFPNLPSDVMEFPLKRHETLYGAFFFTGYRTNNVKAIKKGDFRIPEIDKVYFSRNQCYVSEVNNPFFFDPKYQFTVGSGNIIGLSSAAKAMSQGQFGQFPLYIFTSEGVWAASVSPEGKYTTTSPFTRDVCLNRNSITQLDSEVAFNTHRGIMIISGSSSVCITDSINSVNPFRVDRLPYLGKMLPYGINLSNLTIHPFAAFMKDCRTLFDYKNQRLIIFSPEFNYAYQFSLLSKKWGMMFSDLSYYINSYPECLAVNNDNYIVEVSHVGMNVGKESYVLISRPFKLDSADSFKTVSKMIHRGYFDPLSKESVAITAIYGSRDMLQWNLVWASEGNKVSGILGSPYKFFISVATGYLSASESLCGTSVEFTYRDTGKLK